MADQPFWGKRVYVNGAGPKPIFVKDLSVDKLTDAVVEAESKAIRERAQSIGWKIRGEEGVLHAIRLIESCSLGITIF
jgi:sterol 3beta-glucosyltransferase